MVWLGREFHVRGLLFHAHSVRCVFVVPPLQKWVISFLWPSPPSSCTARPRLVALVAFGEAVNLSVLRALLLHECGAPELAGTDGPLTVYSKKHKTAFTLFQAPAEVYGIMDLCRAADLLVPVLHASTGRWKRKRRRNGNSVGREV